MTLPVYSSPDPSGLDGADGDDEYSGPRCVSCWEPAIERYKEVCLKCLGVSPVVDAGVPVPPVGDEP